MVLYYFLLPTSVVGLRSIIILGGGGGVGTDCTFSDPFLHSKVGIGSNPAKLYFKCPQWYLNKYYFISALPCNGPKFHISKRSTCFCLQCVDMAS